MQHLSLIKGEKVNNWKEDQIQALVNKTTRAQNPMLYEDEALWTEYQAAFDAAFMNTARRQTAQSEIKHL
jgi:hypothetical protein